MSEERMSEIAARERAATAGPWVADLADFDIRTLSDECGFSDLIVIGRITDEDDIEETDGYTIMRQEDREFMAEARSDIPWLMERVRESGEQLESLRGEVKDVLAMLDELHERGAESTILYERCRDRLRKAVG